MQKQLRIDLFTDVVCPWCLIGTARLDAALAELPEDLEVVVVRHPFQLQPDTPSEGVVVADMLRAKYGRDPEPMWAQVEAAAADAGVPLKMAVQPMAYDTLAAHTLVRHAPVADQHRLGSAIAEAYFLEGRNIADPEVLAELGAAHGMAREKVLALVSDRAEREATQEIAQQASAQGINGVPYFIFNSAVGFSGSQPPEIFAKAIGMALEKGSPAQQ